MLSKNSRWYVPATLLLFAIFLMVACDSEQRPAPIVNRPQQEATDQAYTAEALTNAPPTEGPGPTPTLTSTPFQMPTQFPDAEPGAVIAEVGNREITLEEYQARVRYERWLPFYSIARDIPELGFKLLDLTRPENSQLQALLYTLNSDPVLFGEQVYNAMLTDQVILREAGRMDLELEQTIFDGRLAARIDVTLGEGGARPPEWDEAYNTFIGDMEQQTGMTEEQFLNHIRALAFYVQLSEIIGQEAEFENTDIITAAQVQDVLLDSRDDAQAFIDRLESGQEFFAVARDFGFTPEGGEASREIARDTEGLPDGVKEAVFDAEEGDIIGPLPTAGGWYVGKVISFRLDLPQPADVEALRNEYFRNWIVERLDDPDYTTEFEGWRDFIPAFPLPADVSPLLRTENFVIPDDPFVEEGEPTPTTEPLDNSPR
ncbi:MAG: peptidyl-prolyl cis-trans isomerase [Chloroflexi bacterium]|nr:peptidyl-prolyl cis-trans isomerase [Chloroflexota bacterium]